MWLAMRNTLNPVNSLLNWTLTPARVYHTSYIHTGKTEVISVQWNHFVPVLLMNHIFQHVATCNFSVESWQRFTLLLSAYSICNKLLVTLGHNINKYFSITEFVLVWYLNRDVQIHLLERQELQQRVKFYLNNRGRPEHWLYSGAFKRIELQKALGNHLSWKERWYLINSNIPTIFKL